MTEQNAPNFSELLAKAVSEPGTISAAYTAFHGYSLGNQLLALAQCHLRGIQVGPIASFNKWKELGRHVLKGSKAIELCMPITQKTTDKATGEPAVFTRFVFRKNWFVLSQTDGADYVPTALPGWVDTVALAALDITRVEFALMDGNCQGYAMGRQVAVSPVAALPYKTLFHELAHVVLGHTTDEATMADDDRTPRNLREVEAEAVAMLCTAALGLPGMEDSRGYIQHWNASGEAIPEASARKILKTADTILKAGRPAEPKEAQA